MFFKAKAAAEAVNTEKSKAPFIPVEKVIDNAKVNINMPLNFALNSVLKPKRSTTVDKNADEMANRRNAFIIVIFKYLK